MCSGRGATFVFGTTGGTRAVWHYAQLAENQDRLMQLSESIIDSILSSAEEARRS